ncbi:MAG: hypothetical protein LBT20_02840 [Clostridiales bacterium]|jgi:hypothetical protein|nr:hypothetical protein [Clostridiales bacterium]
MKIRFIFFVILLLFIGGVTYAIIDSYIDETKRQGAIDNGVVVEAVAYKVRYTGAARGHNSYTPYSLLYEYTSNEGIRYEGFAIAFGYFQTEEEASKYIGKKVNIYIDGKGNSIAVGDKPDVAWQLILSVVLSIVFVAGVIFVVWLFVPRRRGRCVKTVNGRSVKKTNGRTVKTVNGRSVKMVNGRSVKTVNGRSVKTVNGRDIKTINWRTAKTINGHAVKTANGSTVKTINGRHGKTVKVFTKKEADGAAKP